MESAPVHGNQPQPRNVVVKSLGKFGASVSSTFTGMFARKKVERPVPSGAVEMMDFSQVPTHRKSDSMVSASTEDSSLLGDEPGPL
jgi:hypothetical protein